MERSSVSAATDLKKCHFPDRNRAFSILHPKNFHPCAGKTIGAERGPFVVVGFPYTACIFLSTNFIEHHDFSPNALKHILSENQAASWEQDENQKIARGVWLSYQIRTFWSSSFTTTYCKNLLLVQGFSSNLDHGRSCRHLFISTSPEKAVHISQGKCMFSVNGITFRLVLASEISWNFASRVRILNKCSNWKIQFSVEI